MQYHNSSSHFDMKVPTSEAIARPEDYGMLVRECLLSRESDGGDHEGLHPRRACEKKLPALLNF
jgi:hypothetical protein